MKKLSIYIYILLAVAVVTSCKKILDEIPDKGLMIPKTLKEFQSVLDMSQEMNLSDPWYGIASSDDYYLPEASFKNLSSDFQRELYIWGDHSMPETPNEWAANYSKIYNANLVLEGVRKIERTVKNAAEWDQLIGAALLYRGKSFLEIALIWTQTYDAANAANMLGIPLRDTTDFAIPSYRANLAETYDQIITDLKEAAMLLPATPSNLIRPSKPAAYAYLARTYLAMQDYENAGYFADLSLKIKSELLDYSTLDPWDWYPFPGIDNPEIIMYLVTDLSFNPTISQEVLDSYEPSDYRFGLFFDENRDGTMGFKGSYDGSYSYFTGVATDEMYLTRAEALVRAGKVTEGMADLNKLLAKRIDGYTDLVITDKSEALELILTERRKELILRGTRWLDLKRLNKEGIYTTTITREIEGKTYKLLPNDPRYVLPIPEKIIKLTGMPQNSRK